MTRKYVYWVALAVFIGASAMTIASILRPHWVSWDTLDDPSIPSESQHIGLHTFCSTLVSRDAKHHCRPFPDQDRDCRDDDRGFCTLWRTTGFLMSLAMVAELASLVGFMVIMGGGKYKRETGWKILNGMMSTAAMVQLGAMAITAYVLGGGELFSLAGWTLDSSWFLCTISAGLLTICIAGLTASALFLPAEDGYDFLEDPIY